MENNVVYGRHPVIDTIQSGKTVDKVCVLQGLRGELEIEMRQLCRRYNIPLQYLPKERMNKIVAGGVHQGVLCFIANIAYCSIEEILPTFFDKKDHAPLVLVLDGITDVRNFGAIARSAECMGVDAIVIPQKNAAQINSEALKTSAGALSKIPICKEASLVNVVKYLKNSGLQVFSSDLEGRHTIYNLDFKLPTAIVIGSEDEGVSHALLLNSNARFVIPQMGTSNSLNASVATGVILYEATRQRLTYKS